MTPTPEHPARAGAAAVSGAVTVESMDDGRDAMHVWFSLSYANYLTVPRSVMQSMPGDWQLRMVQLLDEMNAKLDAEGLRLPETKVSVRDQAGRFMHDWFADYERGRRNVFADAPVRSGPVRP